MAFKRRTLSEIAEMICGNFPAEESFFPYRSSSYLTAFFAEAETDFKHDGSTRGWWVTDVLQQIMTEAVAEPGSVPAAFARVIRRLMDPEDATNEGPSRPGALERLNTVLARAGFEAFYAPDRQCYLRNLTTNIVIEPPPNPHRPFSPEELERRRQMIGYLDNASEDELTEEVLLPLFRQLGFQRITAAGHRDKALEYGKDVWMKFVLPTRNVLYFGIQVKKGKLDSSGVSRGSNANVAEVYNQVLMMLGHEVFDPELNREALVDHAFIIAGGEITKPARAWLGRKLDVSKRSQVMFMDRDAILDLFVAANLPLPQPRWIVSDDPPF